MGNIVPVAQVRRRALGLARTFAKIGDDEIDTLIEELVEGVQADIERETGVLLTPRVIKTRPDDSLTLGEDYDLAEDGYDWDVSPKAKHRFRLRRRPVIQLDSVTLKTNTGQVVYTFGEEWWNLKRNLGVLTLLPLLGLAQASSVALAVVGTAPRRFGANHYNVLPGMLAVDYQAGIEGADTRAEFGDLRSAIADEAGRRLREAVAERIRRSSSLEGASVSYVVVDTDKAGAKFEEFCRRFKSRYAPASAVVV